MRATRPTAAALLFGLILPLGCGGTSERVISEDDDVSSGGQTPSRVATMPTDVDGTEWRFVEARCTEGPLDLSPRGFSSILHVSGNAEQLLLTYDQTFEVEACTQTIVQRVTPPAEPGSLQMEETARVAIPPTPTCFGQPEPPRPGEVNRVGEMLEVRVQRSRWCGGFEVTMLFAPMDPVPLGNEEIMRRYIAHYTRGDAAAVASLFAETGSLLEPFTVTASGDPYRHDGRAAVQAWFAEAFANNTWRALRVTSVDPGTSPQELTAHWEYMDARLAEPLVGENTFTIAAGEIFESQIRIQGTPVLTGSAAAEAAAAQAAQAAEAAQAAAAAAPPAAAEAAPATPSRRTRTPRPARAPRPTPTP